MKEKVVEILVYLMSEIQDDKRLGDIDLNDLRSKGYSQSEISAAFSWLFDNLQSSMVEVTRPARPVKGSRRALHDAERAMLSTESQGYLIQLAELGLLTDSDLESVIDRVMASGYERISLLELRPIVAGVLFGRRGEGDTLFLEGGDTIH
jgi:uncharacterized protein Smg (DUF494 family)